MNMDVLRKVKLDNPLETNKEIEIDNTNEKEIINIVTEGNMKVKNKKKKKVVKRKNN